MAGIIGDPVRHSLSPTLHNAAFEAAGLDWVYVAFPVAPGRVPEALAGARALGIAGLSVTMPHKTDAARACDRLSPAAAALATVNTVVIGAEGVVEGHTTDGDGFVDSLVLDHGVAVAGLRCLVLGAGGSARAVVRALADAGAAEVVVVNRTADAGARCAALAGAAGRTGTAADVGAADLVVNATSVGMGAEGSADAAAVPVDPALLRPGQVVADLVYHPLTTALLAAAAERGCRTVDGLGMLVHQAGRQFRLWTGEQPPLAVMEAAARDRLGLPPR